MSPGDQVGRGPRPTHLWMPGLSMGDTPAGAWLSPGHREQRDCHVSTQDEGGRWQEWHKQQETVRVGGWAHQVGAPGVCLAAVPRQARCSAPQALVLPSVEILMPLA